MIYSINVWTLIKEGKTRGGMWIYIKEKNICCFSVTDPSQQIGNSGRRYEGTETFQTKLFTEEVVSNSSTVLHIYVITSIKYYRILNGAVLLLLYFSTFIWIEKLRGISACSGVFVWASTCTFTSSIGFVYCCHILETGWWLLRDCGCEKCFFTAALKVWVLARDS